MINGFLANKIKVFGLGINFLTEIISFVTLFVHIPIIGSATVYVRGISLGLVGIAFLITWLENRDIIDFALGLSLGVSGSICLLEGVGVSIYGVGIIRFLILIVSSLYFLVFAYKASKTNMIFAMLLCCAFLYNSFAAMFLIDFLCNRLGLPYNPILVIWLLGYVICAGIVLIETIREQREF